MEFKDLRLVYTAATDLEAHLMVDMLKANGVPALAVEDQSGASLWMFGTNSQFHKPNVYVDKSTAETARQLIVDFEDRRREHHNPGTSTRDVQVKCEECGKATTFPDSLTGTVQECPFCRAYVDVGKLEWEEDFGQPDES